MKKLLVRIVDIAFREFHPIALAWSIVILIVIAGNELIDDQPFSYLVSIFVSLVLGYLSLAVVFMPFVFFLLWDAYRDQKNDD
jgi:hypothetical protein